MIDKKSPTDAFHTFLTGSTGAQGSKLAAAGAGSAPSAIAASRRTVVGLNIVFRFKMLLLCAYPGPACAAGGEGAPCRAALGLRPAA